MNADEETNQGNIFEKNGHRNEPTTRPGPSDLRSSASSADKKSGVSVSLTIIARDEQENLPKCLSSVAGLFDEIVVVDTGSTDRTREIAREFGARVFDFVWVNDFAAARNAALARAKGDYAVLGVRPISVLGVRPIQSLGSDRFRIFSVSLGPWGQDAVSFTLTAPIRHDPQG